ncbi:M1 family metallopeptidase [Micromonospora sp. NPDC048999]|uniref:M1 family metallopeptidase n=1 Tax=Micromonospora sp. NPDC048999 TaxID=3155391 RepID=UPI0033D44141
MTLARRGGRRWLGLVVCGALLLAGCDSADGEPAARASGQPTAAATRSFAPGASGAGDAYFPSYGNGGYDVAHYTVQVRYDPKTDQLTGTTVVRATATADLSAFNLDLAGLTVRSVTVNGVKAGHTRTGDELVITPAAGLTAGNGFVAEIRYDGVPAALRNEALGESGWLHTSDGAIALGQPQSASTWFPVNDHPSDKATYDFEISVPKEPEDLKVISNGVFMGRTLRGDWATWSWSEGTPMASYLAMVVIGKFRVTTRKHKGRPVFNAVTTKVPGGPQDRSIARALDIADYLESLFGPYPFDAYGGVVVADDRIRYALETQTRPVYSTGFFRQGENTEVVAHEVAHQWFGNSVSLQKWQDIWLNEGLATYAQWLWAEHTGQSTVQRTFEQQYATASAQVWRTPPGKPGVANLFSESVYQRGGMTVHALRVAVGDTAFFTILRTWAAEKKNGNATTAEFVALAERISQKKLGKLFDAWLYGTERPAAPKPL